LLRWYGIDRDDPRGDFRCENDVPEWGFKFHMNDISATIGLSNLEFADRAVEQHRDNAKFYNSVLQNTPGVELLENATDRLSSYWIYTIKVSRREDFRRKLSESGIMVSQVHERNDKHSTVESYRSFLPQLDSIIDKIICIPVGWWVDEIARNHIADTIKSGW
jgi:dTDP-4-amino-4,6-dideoxy-D-glucose/dTDP-4-amino-2,4-dideoxy-beta-L-xylose transaminase